MASLAVGSSAGSAIDTLVGGYEQDQAARVEQTQYNQAANNAAATSEREAQNIQLQGKLIQSRQQAVAAASGAGATDPTVMTIEGNTAKQTTYDTLSKIWEGQSEAQGLRYAGQLARYTGKQELLASGYGALNSLVTGGKTMFDRYGGGGMPGAGAVTGDASAAGGGGFDISAFLAAL